MSEKTWKETIKVTGAQLVDAVRKLVHEGNVRRVIIKQGNHVVAEFPLSIGVIGVVLAPILAAAGALAAVIKDCTIEVERTGDPDAKNKGGA